MPSRPSMQSRLLRRAVPRPIDGSLTSPEELGPGLWVLEGQLRHFGFARLPSRTTIIRLREGGLVVVSPPARPDARLLGEIDALGRVESVVVPNSFHYLFASEFLAHYPDARLHVPPSLGQRVPELGLATELAGTPPGDWGGEIDLAVVGPVRGVSEVLFFHTRTGTLILSDLAFNMCRYPRALDRLVWRMSGVPGRFGPGRTSRTLLLCDRSIAARGLGAAARWPIARIVVAHGDVVEDAAADEFRRAFAAYLPESTNPVDSTDEEA